LTKNDKGENGKINRLTECLPFVANFITPGCHSLEPECLTQLGGVLSLTHPKSIGR